METKDQKKKEGYVPPALRITIVEMEHGIAAGSAQVSPGASPLVEDFIEVEDQKTWDF